jgi:methylmalonyl-CoA mutase C-terminal domain/subunit
MEKRKGVSPRIRVLLAKPGLDGHDKGVKLVARALMEAGMEVVYLGMRQGPESIARAALQEDPDVIGLSILSGAHVSLTGKVVFRLKEIGCGEVPVIVGGTVPPSDLPVMKACGAAEVFPMGSRFESVISWIKSYVENHPRKTCPVSGGGQ